MTSNDERDKEMCAIALDEAIELCPNKEIFFIEQLTTIMGIRGDFLSAVTPLKDKYRGILSMGISPGASDKDIKKWVIARAWDLVINEKMVTGDAFNQAWEESDVRAGKEEVASDSGALPIGSGPGLDDEEFPVDRK